MFAVLLMLSGCVPVPYKYYYMSFAKVDGLEIVEHGTTSRTAFLQKPMPIRYRLSRASYSVDFKFDEKGLHPSFRVHATSTSGTALLIETVADWSQGTCWGWVFGLRDKPEIGNENIFQWSMTGRPRCLGQEKEDAHKLAVAFKVLDLKGKVLGEERLPFAAERNGYIIDFYGI
ncbi:MAG: hypothetical protein F4X81_02635 [Gammaproteobacteria bacterium]|nr:hypothetical protein [Gammaproteobacteria bacterium]MXY06124.1 hypothetical protein [Gammaproteobacteria bacterium]MYE50347.1 hypothetical protein [Gammaproteobacteria bacterium]MYF10822.1 hypothetical protein [Gammaproteobacteria bacterium]MYG11855.1 hypothetical protein [Gammaproteobacteria bacterium]